MIIFKSLLYLYLPFLSLAVIVMLLLNAIYKMQLNILKSTFLLMLAISGMDLILFLLFHICIIQIFSASS